MAKARSHLSQIVLDEPLIDVGFGDPMQTDAPRSGTSQEASVTENYLQWRALTLLLPSEPKESSGADGGHNLGTSQT